MTILDLGCGTSKTRGAIGIDIIPITGVDAVVDLRRYPYPFPSNTFSEIYILDVIEHLPDTIRVMEELYRIALPEALIYVRVVNWNHRYSAMDPTHLGLFTENSFDFFGKRKGRSYYTHARFAVEKVEYIYDARARRWLRSERLMKSASNYLCNVLQGLIFTLRAIK